MFLHLRGETPYVLELIEFERLEPTDDAQPDAGKLHDPRRHLEERRVSATQHGELFALAAARARRARPKHAVQAFGRTVVDTHHSRLLRATKTVYDRRGGVGGTRAHDFFIRERLVGGDGVVCDDGSAAVLARLDPRAEHPRVFALEPQDGVRHRRDFPSESERSSEVSFDDSFLRHARRHRGHGVFRAHERVNLLVRIPHENLRATLLLEDDVRHDRRGVLRLVQHQHVVLEIQPRFRQLV